MQCNPRCYAMLHFRVAYRRPDSITHSNYRLIFQPGKWLSLTFYNPALLFIHISLLLIFRLQTPHSPYDDDDEIEEIPAVPQVGVGMEEQTVGYDLQEGLHREYDEEQVLHTLLGRRREEGGGGQRGTLDSHFVLMDFCVWSLLWNEEWL